MDDIILEYDIFIRIITIKALISEFHLLRPKTILFLYKRKQCNISVIKHGEFP